MLVLLLGSLVLWAFWFLIGRSFLSAITLRAEPTTETFESTVLLGAFVLAITSQAAHVFVSLPSRPSAIVLCAVLLTLAFLRRGDVSWLLGRARYVLGQHAPLTMAFFFIAVIIAFSAARPCKVEDTENYHAQILRWTESASLVPGLALVHGRLGFNSLWFPLEAVSSFAFLSNGPLPLVNTATFLIGALYLFRHSVTTNGSRLHANLALAAMVPYFAVGFLYAGSQSPDLPALTYGLLSFFAVSQAFASRRTDQYVLAMCLVGASACWKLSVAPLLLFAPLIAWDHFVVSRGKLEKSWMLSSAFLVFAAALLIGRSVVLSGYPLFPSTMVDVFPVDWKAPSLAHGQEMWVRVFARGLRPQNPAEALTYPMSQWVPVWIKNWNNPVRISMIMLATGLILAAVSWCFASSRRWFVEGNRRALFAMGAVALLSTAFWFWQAPDLRFGAAYVTALIAMTYLPWLWWLDRAPILRNAVASVVVIIAVAMVAQNVLWANPVPPWCSAEYAKAHPHRLYWLWPAPYPEATFVDERLRDGSINHVVASGGLAHYGPVPNSPLPIAGIAVRRGPRLSDGYRLDVDP